MSDARAEVMARIVSALGAGTVAAEVPREYRLAGSTPASAATIERFCERVAEYQVTVHRSVADEVPQLLGELVQRAGSPTVATPPGCSWRPAGVPVTVDDPPLSPRALDATGLVITGCALAIADTGTIVLDGAVASGRRALTLVPDHHICVVLSDQIVDSVPDAVAAVDPRRPLTFVSGPSATSDIELTRVVGVHGPRVLDVVVATSR